MNYLIGDFKSEKENYIINKGLELSSLGEQVIIITKEQGTFKMEAKILQSLPNNATNIQVLSFNRLAYRILNETGDDGLVSLDTLGKNLIIRKIIDDNKNELLFYKKSGNKSGFIDEMSNLISEFYNYNIKPDILNKKFQNNILTLKIHDISLIFEKYLEFIEKDYFTNDEALDKLTIKIPYSANIKNSHIFIVDFPNFLPQELKVIKELMVNSKDIFFSFDINEENKVKYFNNLNPDDLYFLPKNSLNKITEIGSVISCFPDNILTFPNKINMKEDISFFLENFSTNKPYSKNVKNIFLNKSQNSYWEIENIGNEIIYLIKNGYRYKDIGIICGNIEDYKTILSTTFEEYNIPLFVDSKRKVSNMSLPTLIKGIMEVFIYNFSYESVFKVLKTEFFDFDKYTLEYFENYCIEFGIKNYKWQFEEFTLGKDKYDLEVINDMKNQIILSFSPFINNLSTKETYQVNFLCKKIFDFLTFNKIPEKLETIIGKREENNQLEIAKEYTQIYSKIISLFEKVNDILGNSSISVQEFYNIIVSGLDKLNLGLVPSRLDEVFYGSIDRSIFPNIKILFIIGVNEGKIPALYKENSIFNDLEREELAKEGITLEETSISKTFREDFSIYKSLFVASEKLYFSYSLTSNDGTIFPSVLINKIKKIFPKLTYTKSKEIISYKNILFKSVPEIINKKLRNENLSDDEKSIYTYFLNSSHKEKILEMENLYLNRNINSTLSEESINELYGKELISSVSKLERFQKCPYAYFLNYNLQIYERQEYELRKLDFGNLFHHILDKFEIYHKDFYEITEEEIENKVRNIVNEIVDENNIYKSSKRYSNFLEKIIKISIKSIWAIKEHLVRGDFNVLGTEISFNQEENGIIIDVGSRKLVLTGKVDRVDIYDKDNKYIKIIDYKSGKQDFSVEDIINGLNLQLTIYLMTLLEQDKDLKVGGMFYFKVKNPVVTSEEYDKNPSTALLKEFKMSGVFLHDESNDITNHFDKDFQDASLVIPATKLKSGELRKDRSNYLSENEFNELFETTENNIKEIGKEILGGNINVSPISNKNIIPCTFCSYKGICKIDLKDENKKYRFIGDEKK